MTSSLPDSLRILSIISRGKWIILFTCLSLLSAAFLYLRYTTPLYQASLILRIDVSDAIQASEDQRQSLEVTREQAVAEMEVLRSREMLGQVVKALDLQQVYLKKGRFKHMEYFRAPFTVVLDSSQPVVHGPTYEITFVNPTQVDVQLVDSDSEPMRVGIGKAFQLGGNTLQIRIPEQNGNQTLLGNSFLYRSLSFDQAIDAVSANLAIDSWKSLSMFQLTYQDVLPERSAAVLNTLADIYLEKELAFRQKGYDQTLSYINSLLVQVNTDLERSEQDLRSFELNRKTAELSSRKVFEESTIGQNLNRFSAIQDAIRAYSSLRTFLAQSVTRKTILSENQALVPVGDPKSLGPIAEPIEQLNNAILSRQFLLSRNTAQSPILQQNLETITLLRDNLLEVVDKQLATLNAEAALLASETNQLGGKMNSYPALERDLKIASRPYEINSNTYNFLLTRRYETSIAKAAIVSRSTVVNPALPPDDDAPLTPKRNLIYGLALALGLMVSLGYVVGKEFLRPTVANRREVEAVTSVPIIAEIVRSKSRMRNFELEVLTEPRSAITESFRSLRSNLAFVTSGIDAGNRTIAVTSTISGEGKSYISTNLCATLTLLKQRVLLVDLDLRKPKVHNSLNVPNDIGASSVLSGQVSLDRAIQKTSYQYFDVLTAGPTPPNPAELLSSRFFDEMLGQLRSQYDYVVIDTSPVGLVTDSIPVLKKSDLVLYIVRSNFSRKTFFSNLKRLQHDQGIDNLFLALNYVDSEDHAYGYGYGYGYGSGYYVDVAAKPGLLERVRNLLS